MLKNTRIGFIGGGNMATAIARGILKKGLVRSSDLIVSCRSQETQRQWELIDIRTVNSSDLVINNADIIILAVKPYQLDDVLNHLAPDVNWQSKLLVSVLAGVNCDTLLDKLKRYFNLTPRLIRVMPNILVMIGEGCSAIAPHNSANSKDVEMVKLIFGALGICEEVPENSISAITGLSGSGPAYIYTMIEALSDGGVKEGLPRNLATKFAAQTMLGAAKMVLDTMKSPGQLKNEVCSAGGTTIHGLYSLEKGNIRATLMSAVEAATKREIEISEMTSK